MYDVFIYVHVNDLEILVQFGAPRALNAVLGPEHLLRLGWPFEDDHVVFFGPSRVLNLARRVQLAQLHVLDERDVVLGVPVQAVRDHRKRHRLEQLVDRLHDLQYNKRAPSS